MRLRYAIVGVVALGSLAGCTVPPGGRVGLTVDSDGHLAGIVAMCDHKIDGFSVYEFNEDIDEGDGDVVADWKSRRSIGSVFTWKVTESGDPQWVSSEPLDVKALKPDQEYAIYGWTTDNSWSADGPKFKPADLEELTPGTVLESVYNQKTDDDINRFTKRSKWIRESCEE